MIHHTTTTALPDDLCPADVACALNGDHQARARLFQRVVPIVRRQVRGALARRGSWRTGDLDSDVEDLTHDVVVHLLRRDGFAMRQWDPTRGRTLSSFVALLARRVVASTFRRARYQPGVEAPQDAATIEALARPRDGLERQLHAREKLVRMRTQASATLSPLGRRLFRQLLIEQEAVDEVCATEDMTPAAVYAWRTRLKRLARAASRTEPALPMF